MTTVQSQQCQLGYNLLCQLGYDLLFVFLVIYFYLLCWFHNGTWGLLIKPYVPIPTLWVCSGDIEDHCGVLTLTLTSEKEKNSSKTISGSF